MGYWDLAEPDKVLYCFKFNRSFQSIRGLFEYENFLGLSAGQALGDHHKWYCDNSGLLQAERPLSAFLYEKLKVLYCYCSGLVNQV